VTSLPVWAQRCSCGGQGVTHLSAECHEPVGPADVDPFAGRACPLCGDYSTGPCPECAPAAIAAVVRVRGFHAPTDARRPLDLSLTPIRTCAGCGETWPCPTNRVIEGAS